MLPSVKAGLDFNVSGIQLRADTQAPLFKVLNRDEICEILGIQAGNSPKLKILEEMLSASRNLQQMFKGSETSVNHLFDQWMDHLLWLLQNPELQTHADLKEVFRELLQEATRLFANHSQLLRGRLNLEDGLRNRLHRFETMLASDFREELQLWIQTVLFHFR